MRKIIVVSILITIMFGSCKKPDNISDYSNVSTSVYPTTEDQLLSVSANAYANLRSENLYGWGYLVGSFGPSEHSAEETGPLNRVDQFGTASLNNPSSSSQWVKFLPRCSSPL